MTISTHAAARTAAPPAVAADDSIAARARPHVLLVDDQPGRLLAYEAMLEGLGVGCVKVGSGAEALERVPEQPFALILLDVNMPGMDGFEVAHLLRRHPRCGATPIIFVTAAHATDAELLRGYQLGAIDYLSMPVAPEVLRSKVAVLVEMHDKCSELKAQLEDADRRKDEFLAMLAHELRNPLAPIRTAAEALALLVNGDANKRALLDVIQRQSGTLARILDDLLDVARITPTFTLRLPRAAAQPDAADAAHPPLHAAPGAPLHAASDESALLDGASVLVAPAASITLQPDAAPTRRVLVVDDNQDAADTLTLWLQTRGHVARAVYGAEAALQAVNGFAPDVVLLDIGLPGMDGYEVARRIKSSHRAMRVVALTGYGQPRDKMMSAAAGFDAHAIKPVDMAELDCLLGR
jgi:CheY-like chemotaxis protein